MKDLEICFTRHAPKIVFCGSEGFMARDRAYLVVNDHNLPSFACSYARISGPTWTYLPCGRTCDESRVCLESILSGSLESMLNDIVPSLEMVKLFAGLDVNYRILRQFGHESGDQVN